MKELKINLAISIVFLIFSIICGICSFLGKGPDLGGMIGGFFVVGIIGIVNSIRTMKNPEKAEQFEMYKNEERSVFIREKTNSKVYSIFLVVETIAVIALGFLGYKTATLIVSFFLLAKVVVWFIVGTYYGKKY